MQHAEAELQEAESLLRAGYVRPAIHSAYYAAFHAAHAALGAEGSFPRTHRGTISEVGRLLVREGHVSGEVAALLEEALETRLKSDYEVAPRPTEDEAEETVEAAREFVAAMRKYVDSL